MVAQFIVLAEHVWQSAALLVFTIHHSIINIEGLFFYIHSRVVGQKLLLKVCGLL